MIDLLPTVTDVPGRAVRGRVGPPDVPPLAPHARVGDRRPRRRRERRAPGRISRPSRQTASHASIRCRAAERADRDPARRSAARLDEELQLRLQAQALPARRRLTGGGPARHVAGLVHPARAGGRFSRAARRTRSRSSARAFENAPTTDRLERLIYVYAKTYLQDDILVKVDRASMACSLEVRAPFLDVDLVEFLGRVPARLKLRRLDTKHLLKRAMADDPPAGHRRPAEEGIRHPRRRLAQGRAAGGAAGRAVARTESGHRASSSPPSWIVWSPST